MKVSGSNSDLLRHDQSWLGVVRTVDGECAPAYSDFFISSPTPKRVSMAPICLKPQAI